MKKSTLLVVLLLILVPLCGETKKPGQLFVIPIAGYSNETSVTFGGLVYYTYRPRGRPFTLSPDTHYINPIFSLNKQWEVNYRSRFYLGGDRYYMSPEIDYVVWPATFYGFGNNTSKDNQETYTNNRQSFRLTVNRKLLDTLTADFEFGHDGYKLSEMEEGKTLIGKTIPGSEAYRLNSIGGGFSYDTRDIALFPTKGCYHQISVRQSIRFAGGDYTFTTYGINLRRFVAINKQNIFAFQTLFSHIDNQAPFQKLNDLGADVRGYESKRYIDNSKLIMRGEYRLFPWQETILSRLGGVLFLESGQVANRPYLFQLKETKLSYGGGLRIVLIPAEMINLRIDFGFSKNLVDISVTTYEIF